MHQLAARGLRALLGGSGLLVILIFLVVSAVLGSHGLDQHSSLDHAAAGAISHVGDDVDAGTSSTDSPDEGPGGHGGVIGACVALAAAFVLLLLHLLPGHVPYHHPRLTSKLSMPRWVPVRRPVEPPDLIALSICRC